MIAENNNNYMRFQIGDEPIFLYRDFVKNSLPSRIYYADDLTDEMEIVYDQLIKELSSWNYLPDLFEPSELVYLLRVDTYYMQTVRAYLTLISEHYVGRIEDLQNALFNIMFVRQTFRNGSVDINRTAIEYVAKFNILCLLLKHLEISIDKHILIGLIDDIDREINTSTVVVGLHDFSIYDGGFLTHGKHFVAVNKQEIIGKMRQLVEDLFSPENIVSSRFENIPQRLYKYDQPQSYYSKSNIPSPKSGRFTTSRFL